MFPSLFPQRPYLLNRYGVAALPHFLSKNLLTFKPFDAIINTSNETNERKYPNMAALTLEQLMENKLEELNAASTTYMRKKKLTEALELYNAHPSLQKRWEYRAEEFHISKRFVRRMMVWFSPSRCIEFENVTPLPEGTFQVYVVLFYDVDNNLIYSKPGTTKRTIIKRVTEELTQYRKNGVCSAKVVRLWDVGEMPPEGLESALRAYFIKKFPKNYVTCDRFNLLINLEEVDKIKASYLDEGV